MVVPPGVSQPRIVLWPPLGGTCIQCGHVAAVSCE